MNTLSNATLTEQRHVTGGSANPRMPTIQLQVLRYTASNAGLNIFARVLLSMLQRLCLLTTGEPAGAICRVALEHVRSQYIS